MRSSTLISAAVLVLALSAPLAAQQPAATGLDEKVQVTLVQVDALVLDKDGKTVPGLTMADFSMEIAGKPVKVSHLDLVCPIGAAADPAPMKDPNAPPPPVAPGVKRRVVFAFDYSNLEVGMRPQVLEGAKTMLKVWKTDDEEVMIVALASGVRVEQKFTKDVRQLSAALTRMQHDVTLWPRDFPIGSTGKGYFASYSTLMDVLGSYDGGKAVVLFSQASAIAASMRDAYLNDVAAHASAAQAAIYPAKPDLLDARGPGDTLVRLASQTGGRYQTISNDLSLPYRRAQRDMSCRYTVAAYVDPKETREPQMMSVTLNKPGLSIRTPLMIQVFSDAAKQQSRAGAAYVDPGPYEHPLVRAYGFSAVPAGANKWDTILAINFPAVVGPAGADVDVRAIVRLGGQDVDDFKRSIHVDPSPNGGTSRSVTLLGDTPLKEGQYDLTVVLTKPGGDQLVSAQTDFIVPAVINDLLILRGPITGRVVPGGLFMRANKKEKTEDSRLGKVLGPENGFEPLFVQEIDKSDKLVFYWSGCVYGKNPVPADAVVARTITTTKGEPAHAYPPVPLKLDSRGKDVSCLDMLETLPAGTLAPGDYRLDVMVTHPNGDVIAQGSQPLNVR